MEPVQHNHLHSVSIDHSLISRMQTHSHSADHLLLYSVITTGARYHTTTYVNKVSKQMIVQGQKKKDGIYICCCDELEYMPLMLMYLSHLLLWK